MHSLEIASISLGNKESLWKAWFVLTLYKYSVFERRKEQEDGESSDT